MNGKRILLAATVILMCHGAPDSHAGEQDSLRSAPSLVDHLGDDAGIFLQDATSFFSAPLHFTGRQWLYTAGIVGGTGLLMTTDQEIRRRIGRNTTKTLNGDFWDIPTRYGIVTYGNIFSITTYAIGLFIGSDDVRITGRLLFESITFSGISVIALRTITGRSRPYSGDGPWKFNGFTIDNEIQSFPSGHTVVAFALSTVLAERLDNVWARIGFYGMACLTAFARVYNNQHWFSDVVTGAALGILAGVHVVTQEEQRQHRAPGEDGGLSLRPSLQRLSLEYRF